MYQTRYYAQPAIVSAQSSQPYGRIISIITPILTIAFVISIVSFQLLHFSFVQASIDENITTFSEANVPFLQQNHLLHPASSQQVLHFSIGLQPQDQQRIETSMSNLLSNSAQHTMLARFSPSKKMYMQVSHYLQQGGFKITKTYTHRLLIDFSGTVKQAEQLFHTPINLYNNTGTTFYANTQAPQVPTWLAHTIVSINGLNNVQRWYHTPLHLHEASAQVGTTSCPRRSAGALFPDQLASQYDLDRFYQHAIQGEGQTIALFEMSKIQTNDLSMYSNCISHSQTAIQTIGTSSNMDTTGAAQGDAELILSTTPQLSTLKIYQTNNDEVSYLDQWAQILEDNSAIVASNWSQCEGLLPPQIIHQEATLFDFAALQGQTVLAASGDTGSVCSSTGTGEGKIVAGVADPAGQPFITSVGGTTINVATAENNKEAGWKTTADGASGGGTSQYWEAPAWQKMVGVPDQEYSTKQTCSARAQKHVSTYCREVPDVALNADPQYGYWIYCSTCEKSGWEISGGTGAATNIWAAFVALTNQLSIQQGGFDLGYLNPLLYEIANDPVKYAASFHDILQNQNDYQQHMSTNHYPTTIGYDMVTGLGSLKGFTLGTNLVEESLQKTGLNGSISTPEWPLMNNYENDAKGN